LYKKQLIVSGLAANSRPPASPSWGGDASLLRACVALQRVEECHAISANHTLGMPPRRAICFARSLSGELGVLCLAGVERRLGRDLTVVDFAEAPINAEQAKVCPALALRLSRTS